MHLADGHIPPEYSRYIGRKTAFILAGLFLLAGLLILSLSLGAVSIAPPDVLRTLSRVGTNQRFDLIILGIRLPQALAAVMAGAGLAVSGAVMQSILRNPLGSPFTLGLSHAAAFGAAFAVIILDSGVMTSASVGAVHLTNRWLTTACAFAFCLGDAAVILAVSRFRSATAEVMVLTGVALGALFTAGTLFLQYFANDVQLATMVFWTFGDAARAGWSEIGIMAALTLALAVYFHSQSWNYNAIGAGDETAKGLGIRVERVRLIAMLGATLLTAVIVAFLGVIGFVGLVCPHLMRLIIGDDMRFLIPASLVCGSLLLLASDTMARLMLAPHVLPVSVITAFLGVPVFLLLIVQGKNV